MKRKKKAKLLAEFIEWADEVDGVRLVRESSNWFEGGMTYSDEQLCTQDVRMTIDRYLDARHTGVANHKEMPDNG